ncbi:MAG: hypothetical protein WDO18_05650 [Acidobacteriota bacterium]
MPATSLWADQITLNNGDRITGTIVSADAKELIIETPAASKVTIQRASITAISAEGPVYVDSPTAKQLPVPSRLPTPRFA